MQDRRLAAKYDDPLVAWLYDRYENHTDDVTVLRRLIGPHRPLTILEPFCGTGRILAPLVQDGHVVTGIDIAPAMLACAKEKLRRLGEDAYNKASLVLRDALDGGWGSGFDLVVIGGNALYELSSPFQQRMCIQLAAEALGPGGFLYVDNDNYRGGWEEGPFRVEQVIFEGVDESGCYGRFTRTDLGFDTTRSTLHMSTRLHKEWPDGRQETWQYQSQKHPVSGEEVREWLMENGFQVVRSFGDWTGNSLTPRSDRAIFWACKR